LKVPSNISHKGTIFWFSSHHHHASAAAPDYKKNLLSPLKKLHLSLVFLSLKTHLVSLDKSGVVGLVEEMGECT
jgi:hypothetical protein